MKKYFLMEGSQFLSTPPSSEQDDEVELLDEPDAEDEHQGSFSPDQFRRGLKHFIDLECGEEFDEVVEEETPRALARGGAVAHKRPRSRDQDDDAEWPDLAAYFALFDNLEEVDIVKICRAYANYLGAKKPANRLRYSHKKR